MTPAVVYGARSKGERHHWVRPIAEFCDGRFEPVDMRIEGNRERQHVNGGTIARRFDADLQNSDE
jgi:hypothetical protein